jgi:hypothetical protein
LKFHQKNEIIAFGILLAINMVEVNAMDTKKIYWLLFLVMTCLIAACGSTQSYAPPVDLPAPITGRVTISDPDAEGNVTVRGSAGAVEASSVVLAVNENLAGGTSAIQKVVGLFVGDAMAQGSFPATCHELGHACAWSEDDGSFELEIPAEVGDPIVLGLIDPDTGEYISELLRRVVGEDTDDQANCAGHDLTGKAVDAIVLPKGGEPVLLRQGNDERTNQLAIGYDTPVTLTIGGCYAHSLAAAANSDGDNVVVVTSQDDGTIWTGIISGTEVVSQGAYEIDYDPMHVIFPTSTSEDAIVAIKTSTSVSIAHFSTADGSISDITKLTTSGANGASSTVISGLENSEGIDVVTMDDGHVLGAILVNKGNASESYVAFFNAETLSAFGGAAPTDLETLAIYSPSDLKLYVDSMTPYYVRLGLIDTHSHSLTSLHILVNIEVPLYYDSDISDSSTMGSMRLSEGNTYTPTTGAGDEVPITKFVINWQAPTTMAAISKIKFAASSTDGKLWLLTLDPAAQGTSQSLKTLASGDEFVQIAINIKNKAIYIVNETADELVDASGYMW